LQQKLQSFAFRRESASLFLCLFSHLEYMQKSQKLPAVTFCHFSEDADGMASALALSTL
jgi:hypothetical protein